MGGVTCDGDAELKIDRRLPSYEGSVLENSSIIETPLGDTFKHTPREVSEPPFAANTFGKIPIVESRTNSAQQTQDKTAKLIVASPTDSAQQTQDKIVEPLTAPVQATSQDKTDPKTEISPQTKEEDLGLSQTPDDEQNRTEEQKRGVKALEQTLLAARKHTMHISHDVGIHGDDAVWELSTRGLKKVVAIPTGISVICDNLHLDSTDSKVVNKVSATDSSETPSPLGEKSVGSNVSQSPYLSTIGMEVDEATNPSFGYTKGFGDVPILLRSEELAPSIFRQSLLAGVVLPDPLNETGYFKILDLPDTVFKAHTYWLVVCKYLGTASKWDELYTLQLVNRHLSYVSTHTLLQNNRRVYSTSQLVGHPYGNRGVDFSERLLPTMPTADFLTAEDEYVGDLSLIPTDHLGKTAIDIEIIEQLSVGEEQDMQLLAFRMKKIASCSTEDGDGWWTLLQDKDLLLLLFDPLRIVLEMYPTDISEFGVELGYSANLPRRTNSVSDYNRYLDALTRFSAFRLPSSKNPLCPQPFSALIFFPKRELVDDRGIGCIVLEAWPCEWITHCISRPGRGDNPDEILAQTATMMREFLDTGWHIADLEEHLLYDRVSGDIFIDPEGLSMAYYAGDGQVAVDRRMKLCMERLLERKTRIC